MDGGNRGVSGAGRAGREQSPVICGDRVGEEMLEDARIPSDHWLMLPAAICKLLQPQDKVSSTNTWRFSLQVYVPRLISQCSVRESAFLWV